MRPSLSGFNGRSSADCRLQQEGVAVMRRIALQPQHPRVDVPHQRMTLADVGAQSTVSALPDTTIFAECRKTGEQEPEVQIQTTPGLAQGRLIGGREEDRVRRTVAGTGRRHPQRGVVDLQSERAGLLRVAPESDAERRASPFDRSAEARQDADGGTEGPVEQLRLAQLSKRERDVGSALQPLERAVGNLKETALDECCGLGADV